MKILKYPETLNKVVSSVCSSIIPAVINFIAITWWYKEGDPHHFEFDKFVALISILGAITSIVILCIVYHLLPKFRHFREFNQYEGRWLQIIPDFQERPYSIIDFDYNKKLQKYELHGINFFKDLFEGGISFNAYRFVERTFRDGFYYITNHTTENKNGLGKLGFIKSNYDNLTRAEGYFFDSSNENCSKKYNTILIKCDQKFFEHIDSTLHYTESKIKKMTPIEIMKLSKKIADREIKIYNKRHKASFQSDTTSSSISCQSCPYKT